MFKFIKQHIKLWTNRWLFSTNQVVITSFIKNLFNFIILLVNIIIFNFLKEDTLLSLERININNFIYIYLIMLYIFYILVIIDIKNKLNMILLLIKISLYILLSIFGLLIIYSLYLNNFKILLLIFLLFILLILLLKQYKEYLKNKHTIISKILINVSNKDYSVIITRMLLFKFIIFYLYVSCEYSICESLFTKMLHNTFMEVGKTMGIEPKTNVSLLETIGMFTVIGTISYGTIKGYQYLNGTENKNINDRLNDIELKQTITDTKLNMIDGKINMINNKINKVLDVEDIIIKGTFEVNKVLENKINSVGIDVNNIAINIETEINIIKQELIEIKNNQIKSNEITEGISKLSNELNENINNMQKKVIDKLNYNNLNDQTKMELLDVLEELNNMNRNTTTNTNNIISSIIPYRRHSSFIESLPISNELKKRFTTYDTNKTNYTSDLKDFIPTVNEVSKEIKQTTSLPSISMKTSLPNFTPSELPITQLNKHRKLYELREYENSFTFTEILANEMKREPSIVARTARTMFNNIPVDVIYRTTTTVIGQAIANSISLSTLVVILESLGMKTPSPTSNAENIGRTISHTIKEFFKGINKG